jgi:hypothetical protein
LHNGRAPRENIRLRHGDLVVGFQKHYDFRTGITLVSAILEAKLLMLAILYSVKTAIKKAIQLESAKPQNNPNQPFKLRYSFEYVNTV